jgi:hypothetical protein
VLIYFRANVLFRNFDVRGGADKTLIYLTLHAVQCLVKLEKIEDKNAGKAKTWLSSDLVPVLSGFGLVVQHQTYYSHYVSKYFKE